MTLYDRVQTTPFHPVSARFAAAYQEGLEANLQGGPSWLGTTGPNGEPDTERRAGYALGWSAAHGLHLRALAQRRANATPAAA